MFVLLLDCVCKVTEKACCHVNGMECPYMKSYICDHTAVPRASVNADLSTAYKCVTSSVVRGDPSELSTNQLHPAKV